MITYHRFGDIYPSIRKSLNITSEYPNHHFVEHWTSLRLSLTTISAIPYHHFSHLSLSVHEAYDVSLFTVCTMRMSLTRCSGCRKDEGCCKSSKCGSYRRTRALMMRLRDNKTWVQRRENGSVLCTFSASITTYSTTLYSTSTASLCVRLHSLQASRPSVVEGGGEECVTWRTAWSEHIIISNDRKHQTPFSVSKDPDIAYINALFILCLLLISRLRRFSSVVE